MPYNYSLLSGKIIERYGTRYNFAKAMGISERSLSLKLSGKSSWKDTQISKASKLLDIKEVEIAKYFFTLKVQNN